ncbi:MAG: isoprenylcysteine carboxylmethyltransferase family protein [Rhodospirillaceae bacterium]|jgi:protein-S-isoprenylcysteine O-methyltransferase Ste14|nr:isoprenylcysteine carboxylmethyltransferase family protein [Rhodospirillaceae bacterium]MBT5752688.1 isoprenylcysteine carboxylmethyltransferase family protein [Rhodospirillaceae bacterium]
MPIETPTDNAGVRLPPPLVFLSFLLLGLWVDSPWFEGRLAETAPTLVGGVIAVLGFALIVVGARQHKKAGSNVQPWKPTTEIIASGLYTWSRNPIYLGMALAQGGLAICGGSLAALVTLVLSLLVVRLFVIAREEAYLEEKFGAAYLDYKRRVRRWI